MAGPQRSMELGAVAPRSAATSRGGRFAKPIVWLGRAVVACGVLVLACGGGDDDNGKGADSGEAPVGGAGGAGDTGGAGGEASLVPLDPSFDCREDETSKTCIAVRGTFGDEAIDRHCAVPQLGNLLLYNPNAWVADCAESGDRATGWWYRIATPAASGFFVYSIAPGTTSGAAITIAFEERGGDVSSEHFEQGFLTTTVSTDPVSGHTTISGKFSASWGLPAADCRPGLLAECERVEVRGNYFVEHFLQF